MLSRFTPATSALAPDKDAWADLLRDHFVSLDVARSDEGLTGAVRSRLIGHLQLSSVTSVTQEIRRSPALIRRDHESWLQVGMMRSGRAVATQDGRSAELGPGDFVVYETTRPFEWSLHADAGPRWEMAVFTWPRASFHLSESRSRDLTARTYDGSHGVSRIVSGLLTSLLDDDTTVEEGVATAFVDQLGDLLGVALGEPLPASASASAQLRVADDYIDAHLGDPDLNPEQVARATLISTRQLHRLFLGRDLTVAQTIRSRRLEGARREINASLTRDRALREIALHWGFLDLDVFSRAFRRAYGLSPRAYRAQQCALSGDPRAVTRPRR